MRRTDGTRHRARRSAAQWRKLIERFEQGGQPRSKIWSKRLEQGRFALGRGAKEAKRELNRTALLALVEGVDIRILRQRKRYRQAA